MPVIPVLTEDPHDYKSFPKDAMPEQLFGPEIPKTMPAAGRRTFIFAIVVGVVLAFLDAMFLFPEPTRGARFVHLIGLLIGIFLATSVLPRAIVRHYLARLFTHPSWSARDARRLMDISLKSISLSKQGHVEIVILAAITLSIAMARFHHSAQFKGPALIAIWFTFLPLAIAIFYICYLERYRIKYQTYDATLIEKYGDDLPPDIWCAQVDLRHAINHWFQFDYPREIPSAAQSPVGPLRKRVALTIVTILLVTISMSWFSGLFGLLPAATNGDYRWVKATPNPSGLDRLVEKLDAEQPPAYAIDDKVSPVSSPLFDSITPETFRALHRHRLHKNKDYEWRVAPWIAASRPLLFKKPGLVLLSWLVSLLFCAFVPMAWISISIFLRLSRKLSGLGWLCQRSPEREMEFAIKRSASSQCPYLSESILVSFVEPFGKES